MWVNRPGKQVDFQKYTARMLDKHAQAVVQERFGRSWS